MTADQAYDLALQAEAARNAAWKQDFDDPEYQAALARYDAAVSLANQLRRERR